MVTELQHEELLEIMGLETTRKDMVVLGALLKAQKDPSQYIDFETLREQLTKEEGGRKGKDSLIYRSLSWLEKEGFLRIDRSGHKHGYNSNIAIIAKAIEKIRLTNIAILEKDLKRIDTEVATFSEMDLDALALSIINLAIGSKKKNEKSVFAQGWENILKLFDEKVYKGLKTGDIIRIKLEWLKDIDYLKNSRTSVFERLVKSGVEIRALDHDRGERAVRPGIKEVLTGMRRMGGKVGYRVLPRDDATYQFIGRNSEGVVLIVSESPLSATWLPRSENSELVDNAIDSFDRDYDIGTDLLEFGG